MFNVADSKVLGVGGLHFILLERLNDDERSSGRGAGCTNTLRLFIGNVLGEFRVGSGEIGLRMTVF
jgi:hypothetical protein